MSKEKKQKRGLVYKIIFLLALCLFIYSGSKLGYNLWQQHEQKSQVSKLQKIVHYDQKKTNLDKFTVDFEKLKKINPDVVGWIVVEDTNISFPVVKGKDNEYYLHKNFEKQDNYAGAIFMDYEADNTFNRPFENVFIYGHNVQYGGMFSELEKYCDKGSGESFYKKHPYVYYYSPEGCYKLQVFSAYVANGNLKGQKRFANAQEYQEYIDKVKSKSRYDTGTNMSSKDKMITLYTCSYENNTPFTKQYDDTKRYYIHCKMIKALDREMPFNVVR